MSLSDVARAKNNAGNPSARKNRSITEIIDPSWFTLADAAEELHNQQQAWISLQWFARGKTTSVKRNFEPVLLKE